jgi:hypothetical protein
MWLPTVPKATSQHATANPMAAPMATFLITKITSKGMSAAPKEQFAAAHDLRTRERQLSLNAGTGVWLPRPAVFASSGGSSAVCLPTRGRLMRESGSRRPHLIPSPCWRDGDEVDFIAGYRIGGIFAGRPHRRGAGRPGRRPEPAKSARRPTPRQRRRLTPFA